MGEVTEEVLARVVERSELPILVVNPLGDFYQFLRCLPGEFGMPNGIEKKVEVVSSITDVDKSKDYALVLSGIAYFEVMKQDIGARNHSRQEGIDFLLGLETPFATLTECCDFLTLSEISTSPNLLYLGTRPTDYKKFVYILDCYNKGKVSPMPNESVDSIFGDQQYRANLREVEDALGKKIE
ncbi:hypothetical protein HN695_05210 [Candidatus Woesearchaeota archaeon]|jgi:hypothetical protein|nr:hypothetical protein [Candidatus Woesearchaeota archaeon]MBT5272530.1 hypothetical protein [Candidatus Woesearchaeota archaeon]MBT6041462.1 hypothetical protein [Candidatus Woesearchaeota archaeon]MBT6336392.1 hypothetical protein [Candidatus Woesearchaeota archaeon]MBT7927713.1 hypothetical protein [Candidatus Woesearchaeota archaeon]